MIDTASRLAGRLAPVALTGCVPATRSPIAATAIVFTHVSLRGFDLFYKLRVMSTAALGTLELTTLLAVARLKEKAYGLAIRRDLAARTGRDYSVGAVYTTLQRLEDKGLLTSQHSEPLPVRGGRSRRHFTLTGAGARALREAERHAASIWAGIGRPLRPRLA